METTSVTRAQIAAGLRELGLGTGVVAFVHSSLSSFGHVEGGAEAVVAAFLEVLGPEGTLAAPIFRRFFWEGPDQVWDRDASPSLMGRISEAVRTWPGARRSAHAPHPIAAVGRLAADLTGRRNRSDFAFDSPFARLIELEARIVLVGVGYQVCTLIHLLEERCEIPYRHWVELEGTVVEDGRAARRAYPFLRRHEGVHNDFAPLGEALEREGLVRQVTVGDSRLRAFGARDLYDQGLRCLRRDPLFLVSRETRAAAEAHLSRFGATLDRAAVPGIQQPSHPVARRLAGVLRVPAAPAPPEAQVRHRWEMGDGVTIEELRLTGGPNPLVPAALALPAGSRGPLPAVICLHGTGGSWERLMEEPFRPHPHAATLIGWGRELARRGFAVLALTQLAHPPRPEPWDWEGSKLFLPYGRTAMGQLVGDVSFAVDYLTRRPEIDPGRIAAAGFSLGGIAAFYGLATDERLAAAVCFCGGVGSLRELVRTGSTGFHSVYFYTPDQLARGLDHPDLVPALAPRPLLVCAAAEDRGMPVAGVRAFEAAARAGYGAAGAGDRFELVMAEGPHALTVSGFERAAAWLARHLGA